MKGAHYQSPGSAALAGSFLLNLQIKLRFSDGSAVRQTMGTSGRPFLPQQQPPRSPRAGILAPSRRPRWGQLAANAISGRAGEEGRTDGVRRAVGARGWDTRIASRPPEPCAGPGSPCAGPNGLFRGVPAANTRVGEEKPSWFHELPSPNRHPSGPQ